MAAIRLQIVAEKLEEKCKTADSSKIDKLYGSFLMEVRYLKTAIAQLAEQTLNLENIDKFRSCLLKSQGVWSQSRKFRVC